MPQRRNAGLLLAVLYLAAALVAASAGALVSAEPEVTVGGWCDDRGGVGR